MTPAEVRKLRAARAAVRTLAEGIRASRAASERPENLLERGAEIAGMPLRRAQSIARRFEVEIASELGVSRVEYRPARREKSGRGAFGRLGGSGRRSVADRADVRIVETP